MRAVINPSDTTELETSLRYYGRDYDNPHSRGIAAASETFGKRQRNEMGARMRFVAKPIKGLQWLKNIRPPKTVR